MCEPLINKIMKEKHDDMPVSGFEHFSKDDVVSAFKFYKKWKATKERWVHISVELKEQEPKAYQDWINACRPYTQYNNWLFEYSFKDVAKNV